MSSLCEETRTFFMGENNTRHVLYSLDFDKNKYVEENWASTGLPQPVYIFLRTHGRHCLKFVKSTVKDKQI